MYRATGVALLGIRPWKEETNTMDFNVCFTCNADFIHVYTNRSALCRDIGTSYAGAKITLDSAHQFHSVHSDIYSTMPFGRNRVEGILASKTHVAGTITSLVSFGSVVGLLAHSF